MSPPVRRLELRSIWNQPLDGRTVSRHVLALGHCQNQDDQNVILDPIDQPVTLFEEFDLVAVAQIPMQFRTRDARLLKALFEQFLEL